MDLTQWASLVAPPVTTLLLIFGIVVVRGTKISEFRQKWIDDQRGDLALILAHSSRLATGKATDTEDDLLQLDLAAGRIKLREKPRRPEWTDTIAAIDAIRSKVGDVAAPDARGVDVAADQNAMVRSARKRLKDEWNRVRRGEIGYRLLIVLAATLTLASLLPLAAAAVYQLSGLPLATTPRTMLEKQGTLLHGGGQGPKVQPSSSTSPHAIDRPAGM